MHELPDEQEKQVLGELLKHKLDVMLEYIGVLPAIKQQLHAMDSRLHKIELDIGVIRKAVTSHNQQLNDHETRLKKVGA